MRNFLWASSRGQRSSKNVEKSSNTGSLHQYATPRNTCFQTNPNPFLIPWSPVASIPFCWSTSQQNASQRTSLCAVTPSNLSSILTRTLLRWVLIFCSIGCSLPRSFSTRLSQYQTLHFFSLPHWPFFLSLLCCFSLFFLNLLECPRAQSLAPIPTYQWTQPVSWL